MKIRNNLLLLKGRNCKHWAPCWGRESSAGSYHLDWCECTVILWISMVALKSHQWLRKQNWSKKETFEFILKAFNSKGILISQPAHMDIGKSSHLDNCRGKAETSWCVWMKVCEKLARVQMLICHIPCKYALIVFIFKCPESAIMNVNVTLPRDFQHKKALWGVWWVIASSQCSLQNRKRARTSRRRHQSCLASPRVLKVYFKKWDVFVCGGSVNKQTCCLDFWGVVRVVSRTDFCFPI